MCVFIWEKYWTATYRAGQLNDGVFYVILSVKVYHRDGTDERWSTDASMSAQLLVLKETKTKLPYMYVLLWWALAKCERSTMTKLNFLPLYFLRKTKLSLLTFTNSKHNKRGGLSLVKFSVHDYETLYWSRSRLTVWWSDSCYICLARYEGTSRVCVVKCVVFKSLSMLTCQR